ncbi:MAG: RDD family protein [Hyphomicrobiales bacterium]|nr:RDD family protein [Hyphomicrobiales bacterium]
MSRHFPRFQLRLQAAIVDGLIVFVLFLASGLFIARFDLPAYAKVSFVALVILAFEPGLVSLTGSTIGHYLRNLKVEDAETGRRLNLIRAIVRFTVKAVLGLYSLTSILITQKHQAVHDMAVGSVVVLRHPERYSQADRLPERKRLDEAFVYPSRLRRVLAIVLYLVALLISFVFALHFLLSNRCFLYDECGGLDDLVEFVVSAIWIAGFFSMIYFGANGRLWGARKRPCVE